MYLLCLMDVLFLQSICGCTELCWPTWKYQRIFLRYVTYLLYCIAPILSFYKVQRSLFLLNLSHRSFSLIFFFYFFFILFSFIALCVVYRRNHPDAHTCAHTVLGTHTYTRLWSHTSKHRKFQTHVLFEFTFSQFKCSLTVPSAPSYILQSLSCPKISGLFLWGGQKGMGWGHQKTPHKGGTGAFLKKNVDQGLVSLSQNIAW